MLEQEAWGKLTTDLSGAGQKTLSLIAHSADVAAVTQALLALPTIRSRLEHLAGVQLEAATLSRFTVFAFLHDVGKACVGFQSKRLSADQQSAVLRCVGLRLDECGHVLTTAPLFLSGEISAQANTALGLSEIFGWGNSASDLWLAAISHHGDPVRVDDLRGNGRPLLVQNWRSVGGYDPIAVLAKLGRAARSWFPLAFSAEAPRLPDVAALVHAFAGLVSLADWIASNPAPGFFPYDAGGADRMAFARPRAREVLREMRIDVEDARADLIRRCLEFGDVFQGEGGSPFMPTELQAALAGRDFGPVVAAEDETGAGKTEAALWRFKTLFEQGAVDSLAFLLPTRVAAVALEHRVRRFAERLFPDETLRPNVLLAVPGYLRVDGEDGQLLARFETQWPDSEDAGRAHRRWAAENTKRYLAAAVSVGTIDQALLAGLTTRHAHLRGAALMRSLIVVDEVHASDTYMTALLGNLLGRHRAAGGHALLLSATLGNAARNHLLERRFTPKIGAVVRRSDPAIAAAVPYPAISDCASTRPIAVSDTAKTVAIRAMAQIDEPAAVAALALDAARCGARVLVIRNTVRDAVDTQRAIERLAADWRSLLFRARGIIAPHHGRFAAADRRILDEAVELALGRSAQRDRGLVLIGTQTLEQSLDIDADFLITDLAPVDILLQRVGRLHRHIGRERPPGYETAQVTVLTPLDRCLSLLLRPTRNRSSHGLGSVYTNLLAIEATWREIEGRPVITVPLDNRALVERVTDPDQLRNLAEELGEHWERHWAESHGKRLAQRSAAEGNALDWSEAWSEFRWVEPGETVKTRLGLEDRLLELPEIWVSPFGSRLTCLKVPGWMVPRDAPDAVDSILEATAQRLGFGWGGFTFNYDRMGLRRMGRSSQANS
jgi:CRISPR-associated endonuclease/helicase Cas3